MISHPFDRWTCVAIEPDNGILFAFVQPLDKVISRAQADNLAAFSVLGPLVESPGSSIRSPEKPLGQQRLKTSWGGLAELWESKLSAVTRLARSDLASAMICYRGAMCQLSCETRPLGEYEGRL